MTQLKSVMLTLGLMDLRLTVEQAVLLSRLEEEYQVRFAAAQRQAPHVPASPFQIQTSWRYGGS